jgi:hypothetical protein
VFEILLENGDKVKIVAEDRKDPDLLLFPAETRESYRHGDRRGMQRQHAINFSRN